MRAVPDFVAGCPQMSNSHSRLLRTRPSLEQFKLYPRDVARSHGRLLVAIAASARRQQRRSTNA